MSINNALISFRTIDPRPAAREAELQKLSVPGVYHLGVEMTLPALVGFFSDMLGENIDPQHSGGDNSQAACEAALTWDLSNVKKALDIDMEVEMATVRADMDALAAMVIVTRRLAGETFDLDMMSRIGTVAEADKSATTVWEPVELPSEQNRWPGRGSSDMAALAAMCADFRVSLDARVARMAAWLENGIVPEDYQNKVEEDRDRMIAAIAKTKVEVKDGVACAESDYAGVSNILYHYAPVGVAVNHHFRFQGGEAITKFTVMQFSPGYADIKAVWAELSEREPGWGGSPTIGGSPQGVSSALTLEEVVAVVAKYVHH